MDLDTLGITIKESFKKGLFSGMPLTMMINKWENTSLILITFICMIIIISDGQPNPVWACGGTSCDVLLQVPMQHCKRHSTVMCCEITSANGQRPCMSANYSSI